MMPLMLMILNRTCLLIYSAKKGKKFNEALEMLRQAQHNGSKFYYD
jgi:hypothetical protein